MGPYTFKNFLHTYQHQRGEDEEVEVTNDEQEQDIVDDLDVSIDTPTDETIPEDPNKQGLIRRVKGAHLVYKRKTDEGSYEELWIYNVDQKTFRTEYQIRHDILAGTDIPEDQTQSEDGTQVATFWTCGNAQLICISNLPN